MHFALCKEKQLSQKEEFNVIRVVVLAVFFGFFVRWGKVLLIFVRRFLF
jgi:hypothetical protein